MAKKKTSKENTRLASVFSGLPLTEGTIVRGEKQPHDPTRIPFGVFVVDLITGGGVPLWQSTCLWGGDGAAKTTLAANAVATAQKICWRCGSIVEDGELTEGLQDEQLCGCSPGALQLTSLWVDAEGTLDEYWLSRLGADPDSYLKALPDYGEQAVDIAEAALRADDCGLLVFDSLAALVPTQEMDASMDDQFMGTQARMVGRAVRVLKQRLIRERKREHPCAVIFTNQMRHKIGVMFGCLHGWTKIPLVDGRSFTIRELVDKRISGEVWSYNETERIFEPRRITDWHYNGEVTGRDDYLHITAFCPDTRNGTVAVTVTPNHKVYGEDGWVEASELSVGDRILTKYLSVVNGSVRDFLFGSLCGDSCLSIPKFMNRRGILLLQDNKNPAYVQWKVAKLSPFLNFAEAVSHSSRGEGRVKYRSDSSHELYQLKKLFKERDPTQMLLNFCPLSFAVWVMDDAHYDEGHKRYSLSVKRFKGTKKLYAVSKMLVQLGYINTPHKDDGLLVFTVGSSRKIAHLICSYVPVCMQYKLPPDLRGRYVDFCLTNRAIWKETYAQVHAIRRASTKQMRLTGKYDISVDGNRNYLAGGLANGILVHNSPESMSGGFAMKHEFSLLLRCGKLSLRTDKLPDKLYTTKGSGELSSDHASRHNVAVKKNKVFVLGNKAEYVRCNHPLGGTDDLEGTVRQGSVDDKRVLLSYAAQVQIVTKEGTRYKYDGKYYSQGELMNAIPDFGTHQYLALTQEIIRRKRKEYGYK